MNRKKVKLSCLTIVLILAIVLLPLFFYAPYQNYVMNRISLVTSRGFVIPSESSLYEFRVLELNSGSGEWWIYGEDKHRYYFAGDGAIPHSYVSIKKDEAAKCPGFNPIAFDTWCTSEPPHEPNGG